VACVRAWATALLGCVPEMASSRATGLPARAVCRTGIVVVGQTPGLLAWLVVGGARSSS
jgi:hypothetical protein